MDSHFRRAFNEQFSEALYGRYHQALHDRLHCAFGFRLAETPVFIPLSLRKRLEESANAIVEQLSDPVRLQSMMKAIPPQWDAPGMDGLPSFVQVDFAIVRHVDGSLVPRLIELQGFPSLTAFQVVQRDAWKEALKEIDGLDREWSCWFSALNRESFLELARKTIVGDHEPDEVILMDLDPQTQKTLPDFEATRQLFGVDSVCPTALEKKGRDLFRRVDGKLRPVRRIYNRVVFDELEKKNVRLPFDYREPLHVEWAPHPNWYWVWSKYSLPFLDHDSVPKARFISELEEVPADLTERYVLKPLFSFAGGGVNVEPTTQDIDSIPDAQRGNWVLQEKIEYEPALEAVDGGKVKVEIRMMFLRPEGEPRPILAQNLVRLSRGKMLGVDFNKDLTWVGSSIGLFVE